jgi:flagellar M-ring protein FliF
MSDLSRFMSALTRPQRTALVLGLLAIVALVAALAWWALRAPYGVLFSELAEADAGAILQELDKLKVPYRISDDGKAILVPQASVHKTRMTLMGRSLPLHGAVGFELFNNTEFGVSDFVQKVNYQRALQGELTRTIGSIEQVQSVRVHLALPEQGLFRKDVARPKAAVTLSTQAGKSLTAAQVLGIQRLVAASVPDIRAEDVTVIDQYGVTLSRPSGDEAAAGAIGAPLDARVELENHLTRKATQVLERMFGKGAALVTVDVALSMQQTKVTTEEVLPAAGAAKDQLPTGVVVRERTTTRDAAAEGGKAAGPSTTSQELDYATGKRTEQVVSPGGAVSRVNVAVVLKSGAVGVDPERVRAVVAAAVGAQPARGDVVAVYSTAAGEGAVGDEAGGPTGMQAPGKAHAAVAAHKPPERPAPAGPAMLPSIAQGHLLQALLMLAAVAAVLAAVTLVVRRSRARRRAAAEEQPLLSNAERQSVLHSVQAWLAVPERRYEA